jgi:hypothetical protein
MGRRAWAVGVAGVCLLAACNSIGLKSAVIAKTTRGDEQRRETFEATLRVLDEHPEYVDEFFALAQEHPATLDRFIGNAAGHLDQKPLAKLTAGHLVENPKGLQEILEQTLDAAKTPQSQAAISRAIGARPKEAARAILMLSSSVQAITEQTLLSARDNPAGLQGLLVALQRQSGPLVEILAADPPTLKILVGGLVQRASADPKLAALLVGQSMKALGRLSGFGGSGAAGGGAPAADAGAASPCRCPPAKP